MLLRISLVYGLFLIIALSILSLLPGSISGEFGNDGKYAIIIVSNPDLTETPELNKSHAFYEYLLEEDYSPDDVRYLSYDPDMNGVDAISNVSNVEGAFLSLMDSSDEDSEIVIYVSDHGHMVEGESFLRFSDGSISYSTLGSWIDEMDYSELVYLSGGNRSGLAGSELIGAGRTIICSMKSDQVIYPDLFNITRGLEDPSSDIDGDGIVSYHEAYLKECYNLRFSDQDPQYFYSG